MIAGLHKGKAFGPLIRYVFHGRNGDQVHRGIPLGGTILAGTPEDLTAFFESLQSLRPDVINPVHHVHISLAPGETLAIHQWLHAAAEIARTMRWGHWVVVGHEDTGHEHVHIIGTRLSEGRVYPELLRDMRLLMACLRRLEVEFGLHRVETPVAPRNRHGRVAQDERRPNRERAMAREGKTSRKQALRDAIDAVIAEGHRKGAVLIAMKQRGYEPFTAWRDGRPVGICWTEIATGQRMTGARLGREYGGKGFFDRIGGLDGQHSNQIRIDPERLRPYDAERQWDRIVRRLTRRAWAMGDPRPCR